MLEARLDLRTRTAWTIGCMPELVKNVAWDLFVLFHYTQVVGLSGARIGLALAIILICDALIDPYVGSLSDRLRDARFGRRHTPMLLAMLPFAVGLVGVFSPPAELGQWGLAAWLTVFGVIARVGISFYTVPALALGAELSRDPAERNLIATLRNVGNNLAVLAVPLLAFQVFFQGTPEYPRGQLNPAPYAAFGVTMACIAVAAMMIGAFGTRARLRAVERLESPHYGTMEKATPLSVLRHLARAPRITPNVGRLMVLIFLVLICVATIGQLSLHLSTYLWQLDGAQNQMLLTSQTLGSLLGVVAALPLARRAEPRALMIAGLLGYFALHGLSIALPLAGLGPAPDSTGIGTFAAACRFIAGLAYGAYLVPLGAIILDIGDEHEANTGTPQQGLVAGVHFLGLQVAGALVGLVAGMFLDLIAFPRGIPVDQMPADKVRALGLFVCAMLAAAGLLLMFTIRALEVSRARQAAIRERLAALRAGAN